MTTKTFPATSNTELKPRRISTTRLENPRDMVEQTTAFASLYKDDDEESFYAQFSPGKTKPKKESKPEILLVQGSHGMHYARQGLVGTILHAYNDHHNLQLRPDDVWITILTQFCAYVNGRAEALRSKFVRHQGKEKLVVQGGGSIWSADFAWFTRAMLDEIAKHLVDPSLREWFLPGFSTSTPVDDVCAAATAMCTFQEYFEYKFQLLCGIPQVTLLGTVEDWELLRTKIEQLGLYDTKQDKVISDTWLPLLRNVCDNFVESAKNGSKNNLDFWDKIASYEGGGSGPTYISGWVSVFSYFDKDGKVVAKDGKVVAMGQESEFLFVDTDEINHNVVSCPVTIDDNGTEYKSRLFVGQMSYDQIDDTSVEYERMNLMPRNDWVLVIEKNLGKESKE